jgi:Smg protein
MKANVLDVLIYLFDHYTVDSHDANREALVSELEEAGFQGREIDKAFAWLEALSEDQERRRAPGQRSVRIFAPQELDRLDAASRGFLMDLEQSGVLTPTHREIVIDRIMALDAEDVDLEQVKWVTLMVLFNMPGQEAAYALLEDLVLGSTPSCYH